MNGLVNILDEDVSLEELHARLDDESTEEVREKLIDEFFSLVEYRNAVEWNRLVRVCEALAIVGWGEYEPVDARATRWLNGRPYTDLLNRFFEKRYLSAGWSRRGDTFVLDERGRYYYASPDRPDVPERDTDSYARQRPDVDGEDYGVTELASQRNLLARNPIRLQRSGNALEVFQPFIDELLALKRRLDRDTRPGEYGRDFDYIGLTCQFSNVWGVYFHEEIPTSAHERFEASNVGHFRPFQRPRLAIGRLSTAGGELRLVVERHFPEAFARQPLAEQKRAFAEDIHEVLDVLEKRLRRRKADFAVALLRTDFTRIADEWL